MIRPPMILYLTTEDRSFHLFTDFFSQTLNMRPRKHRLCVHKGSMPARTKVDCPCKHGKRICISPLRICAHTSACRCKPRNPYDFHEGSIYSRGKLAIPELTEEEKRAARFIRNRLSKGKEIYQSETQRSQSNPLCIDTEPL